MNSVQIESQIVKTASCLDQEINWCCQVMDARFEQYFASENDPHHHIDIYTIDPPDLSSSQTAYAAIIHDLQLNFQERITIMIALLPHLRPQALDLFCLQNQTLGRSYTEFGGWRGKNHVGFLPTCETIAFILAGRDSLLRLEVLRLFERESNLIYHQILQIDYPSMGEPCLSSSLNVSSDFLNLVTQNQQQKPDFGIHFPAKRITSKLSWDDLVIHPDAKDEIEQMITWIRHSQTLIQHWGLEKNIKPGYRSLFYGPPGTGKTLTATLMGLSTGVDVYRIDLSMVVSKYIGETEKNLAGIFDQAEKKNWILFFDEADALFGKRTQTSNANDRHANQQISYLLQRIEDFPGVVILASNLKTNMDEAFSRRFQSLIYFPIPDSDQRYQLWNNIFPDKSRLNSDINFQKLAEKYELAGGSLTNVARYSALRAIRHHRDQICQEDLLEGIRKELQKEGQSL